MDKKFVVFYAAEFQGNTLWGEVVDLTSEYASYSHDLKVAPIFCAAPGYVVKDIIESYNMFKQVKVIPARPIDDDVMYFIAQNIIKDPVSLQPLGYCSAVCDTKGGVYCEFDYEYISCFIRTTSNVDGYQLEQYDDESLEKVDAGAFLVDTERDTLQ